ncbi:alpha/beta fold hydrolase [Pseudomonas sp. RL_15y_Pfl2_60]|uniref:alpha/beta fold hydrolase n=1 Tax=Pseudomonas sp. RL_15y_Pfl2_60 TaxID=3088709 RepID=UPI0030D974F9
MPPQTVFFAHANGFPAATYTKLFDALGPQYKVEHIGQHGHDPDFPVNANWSNLVRELIHHIEQREQPVWGVGHSLGGVLHYHAAQLRPELYLGVAMLDSPLLTLADQWVIRAAKRFGFIDRITPAGRTIGRREAFADAAEAHRYFAAKSLFRRFDPDCLSAYIEHGLQPAGEELRLRFDPATEINIYRNVPHISAGPAQHLKVPLAMVRGQHSRVVLAHHTRHVRRIPKGEYLTMPGGHMFPLEHPVQTAELLKSFFQRWADIGSDDSSKDTA